MTHTTADTTAPPSTPDTSVPPAPPRRRPTALVAVVVIAIVGFTLPNVLNDVNLGLATSAAVLGLFALSIGWLSSKAGMLSLGHSAFYGSSAYVVAIASTNWGWGLTASFFLAIVVSTLLGALIGAASIRVKGIGFAMVTLAFGQAVYLLSIQQSLRSTTGGDDGLSITFGGFLWLGPDDLNYQGLWPVVWGSVLLVCLGLFFLNRSQFGILLEAIRDNEERARFSGFHTYGPRLAAFAISSFVAGVGGALFALTVGYVSPANLYWMAAAYAIISAVIGGINTIYGPLIGAVIYTLLSDQFSATGNVDLYLGVVFIIFMVAIPSGIVGLPSRIAPHLRTLVRNRRKS